LVVDLVLLNGKMATRAGIVEGGIAVENGKVAALAKEVNLPKADRRVDLRGKIALPGVIDGHTQVFRPPFLNETFETGTRAAAVGGVTTVVDMPSLGEMLTTTVSNLRRKLEIGQKESLVDFALYAGEIKEEEHLNEIRELVGEGVVGFKITMGAYETSIQSDGVLLEAFRRIADSGSLATVHAENGQLLKHFKAQLVRSQRTDFAAYSDSRPNIVEEEAISRCLLYSRSTGNRLHIAHLSTAEGLQLVGEAKSRGLPVTAETCPHYLLLTRDDFEQLGSLIVYNPPPRSKRDAEALWAGLAKGTVDNLVTDHCSYSREEKSVGEKDLWSTPPGIPGLETLVPLMFSEGVDRGRISLQRFIQLTSEKPAKIYGLYPRKGSLQPGSDADITVIDPGKIWRIAADELQCVADFTPFDGWKVRGRPVMTYVRGTLVSSEGEVVSPPGFGKYMPARRSANLH